MKKLQNKTTLITGATSGIGASCAKLFAEAGSHLILVARNEQKLIDFSNALKDEFAIEAMYYAIDVRDKKSVTDMYSDLSERQVIPDILINNAGLARGLDPIYEGKYDDWDETIDTNIKGLLYITGPAVKLMVGRKSGHIINIGSTAGHEVYPKGNVYCATKFAVNALTQAFRLDILEHGIRVSTVDPGMVETNFSMVRFRGDEERAKKVYQNITPLTPDDVADAVLYCATRPPHVNINEVILTPLMQASSNFIIRNK